MAGKYAAEALLTIIGLRMPEFLQLILPFAYFLAVLLTLGRLHAENELVVLQAGGMSTGKLLEWIAAFTLLLTATVAYLALQLTPSSNAQLGDFFLEQRAKQEFQNVTPGVFHVNSRSTRVIYAEELSDDRKRAQPCLSLGAVG